MSKEQVINDINNLLIRQMEKGVAPWRKPWSSYGAPYNPVSKTRYRGINTFTLNMASQGRIPYFVTYKQAVKDHYGKIRKGAESYPVLWWNIVPKENAEPKPNGKQPVVPVLRYYRVFNIEDVEGHNIFIPNPKEIDFNPIEKCEEVVANMPNPPQIMEGYDQASYNSGLDMVKMPKPTSFESNESYYATLFHELAHSTGHKNRCNRPMSGVFGSPEYAKEELVAELAASYVYHQTGINTESLTEQTASYLDSWTKAIRAEPMYFIKSSAMANKASDYILNQKYDNRQRKSKSKELTTT